MRVIARGWRRDCGDNVVMEADLEDGYEDADAVDTFKSGKAYVKTKSNGDVQVLKGPHTVTLGGKYQIVTTFTKAEVLDLFVTTHRKDKFADLMVELGGAFAVKVEKEKEDDDEDSI